MHTNEEDTKKMNDDTTRVRRAGRVLRRSARLMVGPLLVAGLFGLVFASADTESASVGGAQPIDYHEECTREGCSRGEVVELWNSFNEECFGEGCWQEEVAELAGGGVVRNSMGQWQYTNPDAVRRMMVYFSDRLGHPQALDVRIRPGLTDTFGDNLIRQIVKILPTGAELECNWDAGGVYNCSGQPA
jgi:hypothetical protein